MSMALVTGNIQSLSAKASDGRVAGIYCWGENQMMAHFSSTEHKHSLGMAIMETLPLGSWGYSQGLVHPWNHQSSFHPESLTSL